MKRICKNIFLQITEQRFSRNKEHCDDLFKYGSEQKVKEAGRLRIEGKEYLVKDGDIMHFKFNV